MIGGLKLDGHSENEAQEAKLVKELTAMAKIIQSSLKEQIDFVDTDVSIETIECQRRDGFIPFSHNKGGYEISGLVLSLESATQNCTDEVGLAKMQKIIDEGHEEVAKQLYKNKQAELEAKGVHSWQELNEYKSKNDEYDKDYNQLHDEYVSDEAVRFSIRVMYNGFDEDKHEFTVAAQVNWEFPHFRDGRGFSAFKEESFSAQDSNDFSQQLTASVNAVKKLFNKE